MSVYRVLMPPRSKLDPKFRERIARWFQHELDTRKINQRQLAKEMGTTEATVSRLLRGGRGVGLDSIVLMRNNLHMDLNHLIDRDPAAVATDPPVRIGTSVGSTGGPFTSPAKPATRRGSSR
jgi:predicted XRE-type DNA-binding protein